MTSLQAILLLHLLDPPYNLTPTHCSPTLRLHPSISLAIHLSTYPPTHFRVVTLHLYFHVICMVFDSFHICKRCVTPGRNQGGRAPSPTRGVKALYSIERTIELDTQTLFEWRPFNSKSTAAQSTTYPSQLDMAVYLFFFLPFHLLFLRNLDLCWYKRILLVVLISFHTLLP